MAGAIGRLVSIWRKNVDIVGAKLVKLLDKTVAASQKVTGRSHLGASVLGRDCMRQIWYGWRWAHLGAHTGRILRLFNRGHREEGSLVNYLEMLGFQVQAHADRLVYHGGSDCYSTLPWDAEFNDDLDDVSNDINHMAAAEAAGVVLKQWQFQDHFGHFGGASDGKLLAPDSFPALQNLGPGLAEFKTHGAKSFAILAGPLESYRKWVTNPEAVPFPGKGVLSAKPEHYVQMQTYMHYMKLKWALYVAVCKDTDDLYMEIIYYKPEMAEAYRDRARQIIFSREAPPRITDNPSWFKCKFCDYRELCHGQAVLPHKNCRSCVFAAPNEEGEWTCNKYSMTIPKDFIPQGCDGWEPIK